jgi:hypothetical protein
VEHDFDLVERALNYAFKRWKKNYPERAELLSGGKKFKKKDLFWKNKNSPSKGLNIHNPTILILGGVSELYLEIGHFPEHPLGGFKS